METKELILSPDNIPVLSRHNAQAFHEAVRQRIYDTGDGLFQYMETVAFFVKLNEVIRGKDGNEGDKEFNAYIRCEIEKTPQSKIPDRKGCKV